MRLLIVFVLSGGIVAYSATASSSAFPARSAQLEQAQQAVWRIDDSRLFSGTAFFVSPNHVVTNLHVIFDEAVSSLSLRREGSKRRLSVERLVSVSALYDLALLEIKGSVPYLRLLQDLFSAEGSVEDSVPYLQVRKEAVSDGEALVLLGYPNRVFGYTFKTSSLTDLKDDIYTNFFVNRSFLHGNSGGPVLDANKEVVGVVAQSTGHYVRMIKGSVLRKFIADDTGLSCEGRDPRACMREEINNLQAMAQRGNRIAQYRLAVSYDSMKVRHSISSVLKWLRLSAEQGDMFAQYNLGVMYEKGNGVKRDFSLAVKWYRLSAEQGFAPAQYMLGVMYEEGRGVKQNLSLALKWYRLSAKQGDPFAQYKLGKMYEEGRGVKQDFSLAAHWLRLSAKQDYAPAELSLDNMLGKKRRDYLFSCHKAFE